MVWIHAGRIIASVTNEQLAGITFDERVHESMRAEPFSIPTIDSISSSIFWSEPWPTRGRPSGTVNLGPEPKQRSVSLA